MTLRGRPETSGSPPLSDPGGERRTPLQRLFLVPKSSEVGGGLSRCHTVQGVTGTGVRDHCAGGDHGSVRVLPPPNDNNKGWRPNGE